MAEAELEAENLSFEQLVERLIEVTRKSTGFTMTLANWKELTPDDTKQLTNERKKDELKIEAFKKELLRRDESLRGELRLLRYRGVG